MDSNRISEILSKNRIKDQSIEKVDKLKYQSRENYLVESVDSSFFLSFPFDNGEMISSPEQSVKNEANFYSQINRNTEYQAPEVIDTGKDYILVKKIEGRRLHEYDEKKDGSKKEETAEEIGQVLANIHETDFSRTEEVRIADKWRPYIWKKLSKMKQHAQ